MITFDAALFRQQAPAFADTVKYPDALIQGWWDIATEYISTTDYGYLSGKSRVLAINLLAAHMMHLSENPTNGGSGIVQSASEGSVSVSFLAYQSKSWLHNWLLSTPYGRQLLALLNAKAVGGLYIGGNPMQPLIRGRNGNFGF